MYKKCWILLLSLVAVFLGSVPGFAREEPLYSESLSEINPFYKGLVTEEELDKLHQEQSLSSVPGFLDEAPVYSWDDYVEALRYNLKNFASSFTITFYTDNSYTGSQLFDEGFASALEHTGIPNEGDYIRWNLYNYGLDYDIYDGGSYNYRYDAVFTVTYTQSAVQEQEVSNLVRSVVSFLQPSNNRDSGKIRAVYNYVMGNIVYTSGDLYNHSTHAALVSGRSVCQGYSTLMYRLLLMFGIDNRIVTSSTHAWNITKAGSLYYHIDATWGDNPGMADTFFLKNYAAIQTRDTGSEHIMDGRSLDLISGYPVSDKNFSGTEDKTTDTPVPVIIPTETPVPDMPDVSTFSLFRVYDDGTIKNVTKNTVELDLTSGEKLTLRAVAPHGAQPPITWKNGSSSNARLFPLDDCAWVYSSNKAASAVITASYIDGKKTISASVTVKFLVKVQPESLYISGPDSVSEKKTIKLAAGFNQNPQPANKKVTWTSGDKSIATVSTAGVVKGVKQGQTTITVCSNDNTSVCASQKIEVTPITLMVEIIDGGDGSKMIDVNTLGTYPLSAKALNSKGTTDGISQKFIWKSSSLKVASVDQNGVVTAYKAGKVTITATAADGSKKSGKVTITVKSLVQDGSLAVSGSGNVATKKTIKLTTAFNQTVQPANKKVTWMSGNSSIAKVSSAGVVTGVSAGTTVIEVCSAEKTSVCASHKVTVTTAAAGVTIAGPAQIGLDDKTAKLTASVSPEDASQEVTWKSSAPKIASVGQDGVVTVYKTGTVTITATAADGSKKSGKLKLMVVSGSVLKGELLADMPAPDVTPDEIQDIRSETPAAEFVEAIETTQGNEEPKLTEPGEEYDPEEPAPEEYCKETTDPHFAAEETWLMAGESLILDIVNPEETSVMVGLNGDIDAVLWDEELYMLTAVGEAEVTAFLSTIDPIEIKDMMTIHIVSEIQEVEEVSEETGDAEGVVTEGGEDGVIESAEPAEGEDATEAVEPAEGEGSADAENAAEETADDEAGEVSENQEAEEPAEVTETPAAEPVEIIIRDLGEDEALSGEANGVVVIDRERFELDDETLSGLVFEIENEAVAKLTEVSADEMLVKGIEIRLLAEGETRLVIRQEGEAEPLREIRLVVNAAPAVEEPAEEEVSETEVVSDDGNDSVEDQNLLEFDEEISPDEIIS